MVSSTQTNAMKRILIRDLLRKSIRLDHLIAKQSRNPTREIGKFRRILPPGERSKHDFTCLRDLIRYTIRLTSYGDPKDSPDMFNEGFRALRLLEDRVGFFEKTSDSQKPELINLDLGQVFRHRKEGFRGVIIQWFPTCPSSKAWIRDAGLENGTDQAFYRVLVDTKDQPQPYMTVAAEEDIVPLHDEEEGILHPMCGDFFSHFENGRHVVLDSLLEVYPDDS
mmetsp:Transcript_15202/g.30781  ORF Transcript_15202/g.30781 Transcript_15202/m.30781 type:complete len:223 (-) Transcript_15202:294-962(-)